MKLQVRDTTPGTFNAILKLAADIGTGHLKTSQDWRITVTAIVMGHPQSPRCLWVYRGGSHLAFHIGKACFGRIVEVDTEQMGAMGMEDACGING